MNKKLAVFFCFVVLTNVSSIHSMKNDQTNGNNNKKTSHVKKSMKVPKLFASFGAKYLNVINKMVVEAENKKAEKNKQNQQNAIQKEKEK